MCCYLSIVKLHVHVVACLQSVCVRHGTQAAPLRRVRCVGEMSGLLHHPWHLASGMLTIIRSQALTWKYFPQTRHTYTLTWLRVMEQHFSKSKSRFCEQW
jgi:hypothetical protein